MKVRLKEFREKSGQTRKEFTKGNGLNYGTVENHENGRNLPNVFQALIYARILGVPVEEIFSLEQTDLPQILREG